MLFQTFTLRWCVDTHVRYFVPQLVLREDTLLPSVPDSGVPREVNDLLESVQEWDRPEVKGVDKKLSSGGGG